MVLTDDSQTTDYISGKYILSVLTDFSYISLFLANKKRGPVGST